MTNQITIVSAAYPSLCFSINERGECIGSTWDVDAGGYQELAADRAIITEQEAALYFDPQGVLCLTKWLAIHQDALEALSRAIAAIERLEATRLHELGPRPEYASGAYSAAVKAFNLKHSERQLDKEFERANEAVWLAERNACLAPARTPEHLLIKTGLIASFCDPANGTTGFETMVFRALIRDAHGFANPPANQEAA